MKNVSTFKLRLLASLALAASCGPRHPNGPAPGGPPDPLVLGEFRDDYGNRFTISPEIWFQRPRARYHVVAWHADGQYLIARNDAQNPEDGNLWTRIDWMVLPDLAPYTWGFCLSAYQATTAAAAESTQVARRETPRTGCNGHPFSRMKPAAAVEATPFDIAWRLVELDGHPAPKGASGRPATIALTKETGRAAGFAGCNRVAGTFTITEAELRFGPLLMTKMACQEGMELEAAYAKALQATTGYRVDSSGLELLAGSVVVARLSRPE